MKKFKMLIICGVIITSAILIGKYLIESKPQSKPKEIVKQLPFVDIVEANLVHLNFCCRIHQEILKYVPIYSALNVYG